MGVAKNLQRSSHIELPPQMIFEPPAIQGRSAWSLPRVCVRGASAPVAGPHTSTDTTTSYVTVITLECDAANCRLGQAPLGSLHAIE